VLKQGDVMITITLPTGFVVAFIAWGFLFLISVFLDLYLKYLRWKINKIRLETKVEEANNERDN